MYSLLSDSCLLLIPQGADQTTYDVTCPTDKPCILVDWPELTITMVLGPSSRFNLTPFWRALRRWSDAHGHSAFDFECSTLGL